MSKDISRREFLENVGLGAAAASTLLSLKDIANAQTEKGILPSRTLGRTGAKVSILAFGCGSRFLMYKEATVGNKNQTSKSRKKTFPEKTPIQAAAFLAGPATAPARVAQVMTPSTAEQRRPIRWAR